MKLGKLNPKLKNSMISKLLNEDKTIVGGDSIDSQIDKILIGYESEALGSKNEGLDFRSMTRTFLSEKTNDKNKIDSSSDKELDVESFVNDVVRLVENYDSLLEVRDTIFRRAKKFLSKTYDKEVIDQFDLVLEDEYGITIGKSKFDKESDVPRTVAYTGSGEGG